MARAVLTDYLQNFPFWLFDCGAADNLAAFPALLPLYGFSSISAPEVLMETVDIREGNRIYPRTVIKHGNLATISMQRGVYFADSDFWRWSSSALAGNNSTFIPHIQGPTPRRDLMLIQFFARTPFSHPAVGAIATAAAAVTTAGITGGFVSAGAVAIGGALTLGANLASTKLNIGPFEFAARLPARAFILKGCIPVKYRPLSDLSAMDSGVSVMELDVAMEGIEEVSLAS